MACKNGKCWDALSKWAAYFWQAPLDVKLLMLTWFIDSMAYFLRVEILMIYLSCDFGMDDREAAYFYTIYGAVAIATTFVSGLGLVHADPALLLAIGAIFEGMGTSILVFTHDQTWAKVAVTALIPIGTGLGQPVASRLVKQLVPSDQLDNVSTMLYSISNVGAFFTMIGIDFLRSDFRQNNYGYTSNRFMFAMSWGCELMMIVIMLFVAMRLKVGKKVVAQSGELRDITENKTVAEATQVSTRRHIWNTIKSPVFLRFMAVSVLLTFTKIAFRMLETVIPKWMEREYGTGTVAESHSSGCLIAAGNSTHTEHGTQRQHHQVISWGTISAINPLTILALLHFISILYSEVWNLTYMARFTIGATLTTLSMVALCFTDHIAAVCAYVFIMSIGEASWSPPMMSLAQQLSSVHQAGIFAALSFIPALASKIGSGLISGMVLENHCPSTESCDGTLMWRHVLYWSLLSTIPMIFFTVTGLIKFGEKDFQRVEGEADDLEQKGMLEMAGKGGSDSEVESGEESRTLDAKHTQMVRVVKNRKTKERVDTGPAYDADGTKYGSQHGAVIDHSALSADDYDDRKGGLAKPIEPELDETGSIPMQWMPDLKKVDGNKV